MAECIVKKEVKVTLTLNATEVSYLRDYLQNYNRNDGTSESQHEEQIRANIFNALPVQEELN